MKAYTVTIAPPKNASFLPNGGVMTVNLYKITQEFVEYQEDYGMNVSSRCSPQTIMNWTQPKGEIMVIQRP